MTSLADLQPPSLAEREEREGIRARHFLAFNGVGLQRSEARFEVKHSCGGWTWAHYPYCGMCGGPLAVESRHQTILDRHAHKQQSPLTAQRPFAAPAADAETPTSPAHGPPGTFNNPLWAQRGPLPGNPAVVQAAAPAPAPPPRPVAAPPRPRGRGIVAVPRKPS